MVGVALALPGVDEAPEAFPATLFGSSAWRRSARQVIIWAVLGLLFGVFAERAVREGKPVISASARLNAELKTRG